MLSSIIQFSTILLSLITTGGVVIHDTRIDKVASSIAMPLISYDVTLKFSLASDLHTHTERHSFTQAVNDLRSPQPTIHPRSGDRKYVLQKRVARGHHPFDSYNLPMIES